MGQSFVCMKGKCGKCLEVGERAGRVVSLTGFEKNHPCRSWGVSSPKRRPQYKAVKAHKVLGRFLLVSKEISVSCFLTAPKSLLLLF